MKIKKTLKPESITAVIDTREQLPLTLTPLQVCGGTLPTGDYSVLNLESEICVERKSLDDLLNCVTHERERFEKCIKRMQGYRHKALIIESTWDAIELKYYRSDVAPNAVIGSLLSWMSQGIPVIMCKDHDRAGRFVSRFLYQCARRSWLDHYDFIASNLESAS